VRPDGITARALRGANLRRRLLELRADHIQIPILQRHEVRDCHRIGIGGGADRQFNLEIGALEIPVPIRERGREENRARMVGESVHEIDVPGGRLTWTQKKVARRRCRSVVGDQERRGQADANSWGALRYLYGGTERGGFPKVTDLDPIQGARRGC